MNVFQKFLKFYKTGENKPEIKDSSLIKKIYTKKRWMVFLSITFGYGFFYTCRQSFAVAKKGMLDEHVFDPAQMGIIGSVLFITYATGKIVNGFLSDRSNIKRFMSTGLLVSALINFFLGFTDVFYIFIILWGINGWFQSMGSAPSVVAIGNWFSARERGTVYGVWSVSHSIGEGFSFVVTSFVVGTFGWQWGFHFPGIIAGIVALILFKTLQDRPQTYGLPHIAKYKNDFPEGGVTIDEPVSKMQKEVLKNPFVWVVALSSACMYIVRYGINSWGIPLLNAEKGFSIEEAGTMLGIYSVFNILGSISSGFVSDKFFNSRRNIPTLIYSVILILAITSFYYSPRGNYMLNLLPLCMVGFSIGGLLVFLGGLIAMDISSKKAAGAAMGIVGMFSYIGAAVQDIVSGYLIESTKVVSGSTVSYSYGKAIHFWTVAAVLSLVLSLFTWKAKAKE